MVRIIAIWLIALWAVQASAQTEDGGEKSRVESWLEDTLSAAGRDVRIAGFAGAFSSEASFDALTIADDDGVWLTIEKATLNWSRSALLSGRVDINEIAADKISILRQPLPGPAISTDDSQSTVFEVPELPISLEIDKVDVESILIDASVLGQELDLSLSGSAQLVGGQMAVDVEALRSDDAGRFALVANFTNENRQLDVDLALKESEGGIVASMLNIPNTPQLDLSVTGTAPLSDFAALISLKTNQSEHVAGEIRYREPAPETEDALVFGANLSGDLRPLFATDFHPFFGAESEISFAASRFADGRLDVDTLSLQTGVLTLQGNLELGADNLPNMFNLQGAITTDQPVQLPTAGADITVGQVQLVAAFDASQSEAWSADVSVSDLKHDSLSVPLATLSGSGTIDRSFGKHVTGEITFQTQDLAFVDPNIASAFDGGQSGRVVFDWSDGAALAFDTFELSSEVVELSASGSLGAVADGLPLTGVAKVDVSDVQRFSGLADRPLRGRAAVDIQGQFDVLGGGFDGRLNGRTMGLAINEPRLDPLLMGEANVALSAARTPEGTILRSLALVSSSARILASGEITPNQGALNLTAELRDLSLVEPKLTGAGSLKTAFAWQEETGFRLSNLEADIAGTKILGNVAYAPSSEVVSGDIHLVSPDLSTFADLTSTSLSGAVDLSAKGSADLSAKPYQLDAQFSGDDVQVGIEQLDALISGAFEGNVSGRLDGESVSVQVLQLTTPLLSINAQNNGTPDFLSFQATLSDVAPIAPGFSGPFSLQGSARLTEPNARRVAIDATARGPAGLTMRANGAVLDLGKSVDLSVSGSAPLGLANGFIAPNSVQGNLQYDLAIEGAPQLGSVSGRLALTEARVALPDSGIVLGQVGGSVTLSEARAQVDVGGVSTAGGSFDVSGPVSLMSGNTADLIVALQSFGVTDPDLFETSLSGRLRIAGPLAQSARISGDLQLGPTEIMVPSSSAGLGGDIPDIKHVNAPRGVAATLDRAGVRSADASAPSNAMPLNLVISAPNQIFVRGRGLDAELGGRLVLGGTTAEVSPSGNFELIRGRFDILGRRFVMSEGLINMRGSLDPFLRFVADTNTNAGIVRLVLEGLASAPELSFESDAGLPQEEAISQLLFGRGLENISALQAASLVSAIATLSGRSSGGVTSRLRTALGLSDFDVTTSESGAQQLRAGAYINENIYSEITIDSEGNQAIDLNLDITPNLKAKGGTNSAGNTGIGIFFERDY